MMHALSASQLLEVWEQGFGQAPTKQALLLLATACPDLPPDQLAGLSIGQRDSRLLTLRELTFGPHLEGLVTCPACTERLELDLQTTDLRAGKEDGGETEPFSLDSAGYAVQFRLPNSTDLAAGAEKVDVGTLRNHILERCLLSIRQGDREASFAQLPDEIIRAVVDRLAQADPQADITLSVTCPACGYTWQAIFDIVTYFWREVTALSYRILHEVHLLASAYGWREADILAMSPWRRRFYLEMTGT